MTIYMICNNWLDETIPELTQVLEMYMDVHGVGSGHNRAKYLNKHIQ